MHGLLHRYIQRVLANSDTWEVDPDKLSSTSSSSSSLAGGSLLAPDGQGTTPQATIIIQDYCSRRNMPGADQISTTLSRLAVLSNGRLAQSGSLIFSQTQLLQHLDLVWETIRNSLRDFPRYELMHCTIVLCRLFFLLSCRPLIMLITFGCVFQ